MMDSHILSDYHILKEYLRGGQQLEGGRTLSDHNIQKKFFSPLLLMVLQQTLPGQTIISDDGASDLLDNGFIFAGQQLEDDHTLSEHDIQKNIPLHLVLSLRVCIQFFVKTLADEAITLAVKALDLIDKGKASVQDKEGIPPVHQCLIYVRKQLRDDHTLSEYDIQKKTPLHLVLPLHACMRILENTLADKAITLAHVIRPLSLRPTVGMDDSRNPSDYTLLSIWYSMLNLRGNMQISAKTGQLEDGRTILEALEYQKESPLALVLRHRGDVSMTVWQRLILASRQFEAGRNPSEYDTQKEFSLHLVLRLCGGMPLIVKTLPGKMITSDIKISDMIGNVTANNRVDSCIPPMLIGYHGAVVPKDMTVEMLAITIPGRTM